MDGASAPVDASSAPTDGGADATLPPAFPAPFDISGLPSSAPYGHVLYLNFSGGALAWAPITSASQNTAAIRKDQLNTVVPAFVEDYLLDATHPTKESVIADVTARVAAAYAPFDVQVVTRRPAINSFAMAFVGGRNSDLGRGVGSYGVSSLNGALGACGFNPSATAFVTTSDWLGSAAVSDPLNTVALTIAHEAGHLFGLVHTKLGGTMDPAGAFAWTNGPAALDSANPCGRALQDDVAILTGTLGPHQVRPPVPVASDQTPPVLDVIAPAASSPSGKAVTGCVSVRDASAIQYVMRQVFLKTASGEFLAHQDVRLAAPFTFPPVDIGAGAVVRFLAADRWDNVAERRQIFTIDPAAPQPPACP